MAKIDVFYRLTHIVRVTNYIGAYINQINIVVLRERVTPISLYYIILITSSQTFSFVNRSKIKCKVHQRSKPEHSYKKATYTKSYDTTVP